VVAIRIAQSLDSRVEDLFRVPEPAPTTHVSADAGKHRRGDRVVVGRVGDTVVAHALTGKRAAIDGFIAADGIARAGSAIQLFVPADEMERTAFLVGCDPSLGMLASWVTRRARNARLVWLPGSSREALESLNQSTAHVAGIHLRDARTGAFNAAEAKRALAPGGIAMRYADWEQGFVVDRGNPKSVRSVESLTRRGVRLINREAGSGSRILLDQALAQAGLSGDAIGGYEHIATSHMAVARAVADGVADAGIALRAVAAALDLDFVPMAAVEFDLLIPDRHLEHPAVVVLLDVLQSGPMRAELAALPGYDSTHTGTVRSRIKPAA
jgi:molybdate-binding protein